MATRWTVPDNTTPTFKAMQMYRNYDGAKSGFGDTSIQANVPSPDDLSAFAALRKDKTMTVMVVAKYLSGNTPVTLQMAHFKKSAPRRSGASPRATRSSACRISPGRRANSPTPCRRRASRFMSCRIESSATKPRCGAGVGG